MTAGAKDGAAVRLPPPLVYLGAVLLGMFLHTYVVPLPLELPRPLRITITLILVLPGMVLMIGALGLFHRTGQDPQPWKPTPEIISRGVYRISRNPMYVSMALFQAALTLELENGWFLVLLPPVLVAIYLLAIRHEEAYLARKFGDAYLAYKASVRRWL